jgi:hypothetical protein
MTHYEYEFLANAKELSSLPGVHQAQDTIGGSFLNITLPQQFYENPLTREIRGQDFKDWFDLYGIPGFTPAWDLVSVAGPVIAGPVGIITGIFDKRYIKNSIDAFCHRQDEEGSQLATIGHQIAEGMPRLSGGGGGGGSGGGNEEEEPGFEFLPHEININYTFEGVGNSYNIEANESNFGVLYDRARGGERMTEYERIIKTGDTNASVSEVHAILVNGKDASYERRPKNPS